MYSPELSSSMEYKSRCHAATEEAVVVPFIAPAWGARCGENSIREVCATGRGRKRPRGGQVEHQEATRTAS